MREAWYGRAGAWSAAALDELRARAAVWRETQTREADTSALAGRVRDVRAALARLDRDLADIEAEVAALGGCAARRSTPNA